MNRAPVPAAVLFSLLLSAAPALADQPLAREPTAPASTELPPGADPIGDVLSGVAAGQAMDEEDEEEAGEAVVSPVTASPQTSTPGDLMAAPLARTSPAPAQPQLNPPLQVPPPPPASRLPTLDRPVMIDELGRTPEAPPTASEQAYENRIRGGVSSAQGLQGPLDGAWTVRASDGRPLYVLQLVDKTATGRPLEGAWRSVRTDGPPGQVGLVDSIARTADGGLSVRFTPRGAVAPVVLTLTQQGPGWIGEMWDNGATRAVHMRRN